MVARERRSTEDPQRETTRLAFEAKFADLKVKMGDEYKPSSLALTLVIEQPKVPKLPELSQFGLAVWGSNQPSPNPRPEVPMQGARETDEAYAKRSEDALSKQRHYDTSLQRYNDEMARYRQQAAANGERLRAYAMLVGVASVFGNQVLSVVMTAATPRIPGTCPGSPAWRPRRARRSRRSTRTRNRSMKTRGRFE